MRVVLAFLVWLFSFWTWKDFFRRWIRSSPPPPPASGETAREKHLLSQEGQQESELSSFLSSLPEDECQCNRVDIDGDSKVILEFGPYRFTLFHGTDLHSGYREFLKAVVSSKVVFREGLQVILKEEESCKHMEALGDALRQSALRKLTIQCLNGSLIRFAKCVSSVVLGNDDFQYLRLVFYGKRRVMGKVEAAEFMANIASPYSLRILKSFIVQDIEMDGETMEQLIKPFKSPHSVLEDFRFNLLTLDVQLEHISGMLATITSLKTLLIYSQATKVFTRGYTSLATALCSNQSLKTLRCEFHSSMELKVLLDLLLPRNNEVQCNTTFTTLGILGSIGGKEGIEIQVDMLRTNLSLMDLEFI